VRAAAERHGLRTPIADRLVALITDIEQGRAVIGSALADDLATVAERR
jgi:2-dehydropantoate 2-reductase